MSTPLQGIEHFVVVMLENRSFDHMLGFLYPSGAPRGQPFEGLTGKESNPSTKGPAAPVFKIQPKDPHPYFMPGANPGEGYLNTNSQLFGSRVQDPTGTPTNQGFVSNFAYTLNWESGQKNMVMPGTTPAKIMGMYTPEMLPVLSGLARGYAVCDHWYSSAPTETFPNRAFVAMATSQGFVSDKSRSLFNAPSIYTALAKAGQTWAIYGYNAPPLTRGSVADIASAPASNFGEFTDFQQAVKQGTLANYVFLEPEWSSQGNSQHPNYDVALGEQFLHDIYYTLHGSALWQKTLLIITYDEHGGCYDHVPPPGGAVPPDNSPGELGFDFTRFGVRVPTVLVSPLIAAGSVYRASGPTPFDHTSILATVEKRYGLPPLTARDKAAPSFEGVLSLAQVRSDDPLQGVAVPASKGASKKAAGVNHLVQALVDSAGRLPVSDQAGNGHHHVTPALKDEDTALDYVRARYKAYDGKQAVLAYTPGKKRKQPPKKKTGRHAAKRKRRAGR
ncbi:MAG TPA: alkaline phosphatase family protein [Gammaproteobacteria bacterium]|nr:alkaline phosphatase family protein [Gammaproteobacteria bacterium]